MGSQALPAPSSPGAENRFRSPGRVFRDVTIRVLAVTAVLAAAGSWPAPDTNESHYLCKARHARDPTWCAGDFFLESPEAHQVFYRLLGPPADWLPLPAAAWLGRIAGWLAIAAGLCVVSAAIFPAGSREPVSRASSACGRLFFDSLLAGRGKSPPRLFPGEKTSGFHGRFTPGTSSMTCGRLFFDSLLAALYSLAVRHTTAGGEWVIGGCEGKVFAWGLVLAGAGLLAAGRPAAAWLTFALATAFHVLVGGWAMLACIGACVWSRFAGDARPRESEPHRGSELHRADPPAAPGRRWHAIAAWGLGAVVAGAAILPALALSRGVSPADAAEATRIYVVERLPHHLLVRTFAEGHVSRHVLAAAFAFALAARLGAGRGRRFVALGRLAVFVGAAVAIAAAGCGISLFESPAPRITYGLLRYYWFRLSDGLVPLLLACGLVALLWRPRRGLTGWLPIAAVAVLLGVDLAHESRHWPAADWEEACGWIAANTPPDAVFLTPRGSATFQWRTGRAEVVSWKHVPQSLAGILEWKRRIDDCFARPEGGRMALSTVDLGPERVREVAARYGADWIIAPRDAAGAFGGAMPPPPGRIVYENAGYRIYDLSQPPAAAAS
jgi:hypothetical protein